MLPSETCISAMHIVESAECNISYEKNIYMSKVKFLVLQYIQYNSIYSVTVMLSLIQNLRLHNLRIFSLHHGGIPTTHHSNPF